MTFKGLFGRSLTIKGVRFSSMEFVVIVGIIAAVVAYFGNQFHTESMDLEAAMRRGDISYEKYYWIWTSMYERMISNLLFFIVPMHVHFTMPPVGTFYEDGLLINKVIPYEDIVSYEILDRKVKLEYYNDGTLKKAKFKYRNCCSDEIDTVLRSAVSSYVKRTTLNSY